MKQFDYEYKKINSKNIVSLIADYGNEYGYQRPIDFNRVKKTVSEFNPNLVNAIKVSYRNGKYYVFDGQHTLKVLVTENCGKDLMVECKVFYGMTYEDECELFAQQNGLQRNITFPQKMLAKYNGGDLSVIDFKNAIEECGVKCDFSQAGSKNKIICYSTVYGIYQKYGRKHLQDILRIIVKSWAGQQESFNKEIILGIDIFTRTYADEFSERTLVNRLSKVSPVQIIRDGKATVTGGNKRYANQILNHYNKNTSKGRLENKLM